MAGASLALGVVSMFVWLLPILGFPVAVCGIIVGGIAVSKIESRNGKSIAGLVMSGIGLLLSIINGVLGALFTPVVF